MIRGINAALLKGAAPDEPDQADLAGQPDNQPWLFRRFKKSSERIRERDLQLGKLEQRIRLAHGPDYLPRLYRERGVEHNRYSQLKVLLFEEGKLLGNALASQALAIATSSAKLNAAAAAPAAAPQSTDGKPASHGEAGLTELRAENASLRAALAVAPNHPATVQSVVAALREIPLKNLKERQQLVADHRDILLSSELKLSRQQALLIFGAIGDANDRAEFYLANKNNLV